MIIAIDGPCASGKSTVARLLAQKLGFYYIYSGLLFRALAYILLKENKIELYCNEEVSLKQIELDIDFNSLEYIYELYPNILYFKTDITHNLKNSQIDQLASIISTQKNIRQLLLDYQRNLANYKNIIAEGRDSATVVFPNADYKFFLTASLEVRAQRWLEDQIKRNKQCTFQESLKNLHERDYRDSNRTIAPLKPADNAIIIDNTNLTIDETCNLILSNINCC